MTFNGIVDGDDVLAPELMENFRHRRMGDNSVPMDEDGNDADGVYSSGEAGCEWLEVFSNKLTLSNQPRVVVQQVTSDQSFPLTTVTALTFDTEAVDTDTMFAIGTPTRITIKTAGVYLAKFAYYTDSIGVGAGYMTATINLNNTTDLQTELQPVVPSCENGCSCLWIGALAVNDYLEFRAYRTGGAAGKFITKGAEKFQAMAVKLF